jgi:uncharacterized membrane protein YdjX (TVP38/TMEM64 family)
MESLREVLGHRNVRVGVLLLIAAAAVCGWMAWKWGVDLASLKEAWAQLNQFLVKHPAALFLALVFLPGLPIPITPLFFAAGVVWRDDPQMAVTWSLLAISLNLTWTYWLAAGPARRLVEKLLASSSIKIPDLPRGDHLRLILVLKLTPGVPFFFQNYLLGFLRAPFLLYLPLAIVCNGVVGAGVILGGVGVGGGNLKWGIWGVSIIALGVVLTQLIRRWLVRKKKRGLGEELEEPQV